MPLYELIVIATHSTQLSPLRTLINTTNELIVSNGGVLRRLDHWGYRNLPQKMGSSLSGYHLTGDYFSLRFDANPPTLKVVQERLRLDPRVLRSTALKIGSSFKKVTEDLNDPTVKYNRQLTSEQVDPTQKKPSNPF